MRGVLNDDQRSARPAGEKPNGSPNATACCPSAWRPSSNSAGVIWLGCSYSELDCLILVRCDSYLWRKSDVAHAPIIDRCSSKARHPNHCHYGYVTSYRISPRSGKNSQRSRLITVG